MLEKYNKSTFDISNQNPELDFNNINIIEINNNYTEEEINELLKNYSQSQISIFNSFEKYIVNYIFNYDDLLKLFNKYNYNINNIDNKFRDFVNKHITDNINRYSEFFKKFKIDKNLFKSSKKLTVEEKIFYILKYIQKQKNIAIKIIISKIN